MCPLRQQGGALETAHPPQLTLGAHEHNMKCASDCTRPTRVEALEHHFSG